MKINKILIGIFLSGLVIGLLMVALGINGPTYRINVAYLPINLESPSKHQVKFTVDRSEEYLIEIWLSENIFSSEKMDTILGDSCKSGEGGKIDVSWVIENNKLIIDQGSKSEYGYSPTWGMKTAGLTIGTVYLEKNKEYLLSVLTNNNSEDWNKASPYVEIGLHGNKLEGFLVLQIYGVITMILSSFFIIIILIVYIVKKYITRSSQNT